MFFKQVVFNLSDFNAKNAVESDKLENSTCTA